MAARPGQEPRWADTNPGDITVPTEPQKGAGWDGSFMIRQFMNWWQNLTYQWVSFIAQVFFRFSDLGPDQALGGIGSAPVTAVGLIVAAASFSARVFANGYPIGPISGPAFTYSANSDTYWDLGDDGVWDSSIVAALAAAPALSANHVRVYMVRTNATDRTLVTDFRRTYRLLTALLDLSAIVRVGSERLSTAADASAVRIQVPYRPGHSATYTNVVSADDTTAAQPGVHLYIREATDQLVAVRGCVFNGTQWVSDAGSPAEYSMETLDARAKIVRVLDPAIVGTPFNDSVWFTAPTSSNGIQKLVRFEGRVLAGRNMSTAYEITEAGGFEAVWASALERRGRLLAGGSQASSTRPIVVYGIIGDTGTDGSVGRGGEIVNAAHYDAATDRWIRDIASTDVYKLEIATAGVRVLRRATALASPWQDIIDPSNGWTVVASINDRLRADRIIPSLASESPPEANAIYQANVPKAYGFFQADGAGGFTFSSGFNIGTPTIAGNGVRIVLPLPFANAQYAVVATGGTSGRVARYSIISASSFDIVLLDVTLNPVNFATDAGARISFVAFGVQ